jgi:carboxyl-terminal processing protease
MFKTRVLIITLLLIIIIAFSGGCQLIPNLTPKTGDGIDTIKEAWGIISREYVDQSKLNSDNMTRAAIEGMIETLNDPYTTYMSREEYEFGQSSISGAFDGIGAYVNVQDKKLIIVKPMSGSPAEKAGIKAGDIIQQINGEPVGGMTLDIAISKIRGLRGTKVTLLVLHKDETTPVEITITRAKVEVPSVEFEMRGDIAYVVITQFTEHTATEVTSAVKQLKEADAKGIVLDLRSNPGGLLNVVVEIASNFIKDGIVVQVRSNQGVMETQQVKNGMVTTDLPMVVLVDEYSASGSEVLAGALQDYKRAIIAGNTTYGKGSVNYLYKLSDGSGLYITSARWLTPNGRLIEGQGIEPDIKLNLTGEDAVNWAMEYLKSGR